MNNKRSELLRLIDEKLTEVKAGRKPKPKPATRAAINQQNGKLGTGPKSANGKERASNNPLKHGYYASLAKLNPRDSEAFHHIHTGLHSALHPDGPAETHLLEEVAMLSARLQSLEAAQFALIAGNTEGEPTKIENPESYTDGELHDLLQPDARDIAHAYERCLDTIERLTKIETHLRRAYNRSWDRLERMQRDRHKLKLDESLKRSERRRTIEALKNNRPQDIPARHPDLDEKGKFKHYQKGDPLYRPKEDKDEEEIYDENDPT